MKWSYSGGRAFQACQRQWYFRNVVGLGQVKRDAERRKIYLMGKHDSISAWRGRLVDELITEKIVTRVNDGSDPPDLKKMLELADRRFQEQLSYAREHVEVAPDLNIKEAGTSFALLKNVVDLTDEEIEQAWAEVCSALRTLYQCDVAKDIIKEADWLISQKTLQYRLIDGINVQGVPDLVAFRWDQPPTIVDWKVHAQGTHDAWMQLATYAICLERATPHSDWKEFYEELQWRRGDLRLVEVQLLTGTVREHDLDEDHFAQAEAFIQSSAIEMASLLEGRKYSELDIEEFDMARFPESCDSCSYKPHCWENAHAS